MAANGTGPLVFIDMTTDKSSRMNYEVYRAILPAQIQPNALKLIGGHFTVHLKYTSKVTQAEHHHERNLDWSLTAKNLQQRIKMTI